VGFVEILRNRDTFTRLATSRSLNWSDADHRQLMRYVAVLFTHALSIDRYSFNPRGSKRPTDYELLRNGLRSMRKFSCFSNLCRKMLDVCPNADMEPS